MSCLSPLCASQPISPVLVLSRVQAGARSRIITVPSLFILLLSLRLSIHLLRSRYVAPLAVTCLLSPVPPRLDAACSSLLTRYSLLAPFSRSSRSTSARSRALGVHIDIGVLYRSSPPPPPPSYTSQRAQIRTAHAVCPAAATLQKSSLRSAAVRTEEKTASG
jgi:hypothetical protein